jgi:hypothetical protein
MVNDTFQNLANRISKNVDIIKSEKFFRIWEMIRSWFSSITILNGNQNYLQELALENKKQLGADLDHAEEMSDVYKTSPNLDLSVSIEEKTDFILNIIDQNLDLLKEFYDAKILELKYFILTGNEEILSKIVTNERESIEGTVSRETQTLNDQKENNGNNHPSSSSRSDSDDGDDPPNDPEINQEYDLIDSDPEINAISSEKLRSLVYDANNGRELEEALVRKGLGLTNLKMEKTGPNLDIFQFLARKGCVPPPRV